MSERTINVSISWLFQAHRVSSYQVDFDDYPDSVVHRSIHGVRVCPKDNKLCDVEEVFSSRPGTALYRGSVYQIKSGYFFVGVAEGEGVETPVLMIVE